MHTVATAPLIKDCLRDGILNPLEATEVPDALHYQRSAKYLSNSKDVVLNLQDCSYLGESERK